MEVGAKAVESWQNIVQLALLGYILSGGFVKVSVS
jgi:hypothetical protein